MKSIILVFIIMLASSCNRTTKKFIIIDKKTELKKIIDNSSKKLNNKICRWEYAYTKKDHLFLLSCIPKNNPSSFYSVSKRYKISKKYLRVNKTYKRFGKNIMMRVEDNENSVTIGIPIKMITIYW